MSHFYRLKVQASKLFSKHFLSCWQEESINQSRGILDRDHFPYTHEP